MIYRFCISLIFLVFLSAGSSLHAGIDFKKINLEAALKLAKKENKFVFIDTYASWCGPCKVMDRVFEQPQVSDFFNKHFINVKIDMEGPYGDKMLYNYEVVWLPTLLIFNTEGKVLTKIDQLISSQELIEIAKSIRSGINQSVSNNSSLSNNPFNSSSSKSNAEQDYDPNEKEEVIYVYDEKASSGRPHIMYEEAYLHLQLMDGKHQEVVTKYLSTQSDWSTEKNIKFIFDFLQDLNSPLFKYFIEHKARFEEVIGVQKVEQSLYILINMRLTSGFPRPTLTEAKKLYQYIDPKLAEQKAYDYYLAKLLLENEKNKYITVSEDYLKNINPYDVNTMCNLIELRTDKTTDPSVLEKNLDLIRTAITIEDFNPNVHYWAATLYHQDKQNDKATEHINKAIALLQGSDDRTKYQMLLDKISGRK